MSNLARRKVGLALGGGAVRGLVPVGGGMARWDSVAETAVGRAWGGDVTPCEVGGAGCACSRRAVGLTGRRSEGETSSTAWSAERRRAA